MRRISDIDLLYDEQMQGEIALGSLWVFVLGTLVGVLGAVAIPHEAIRPWWFLALGAISAAALPVHELVHAAAFKLFSGFTARIRFGFSNWMLYTTAAGTVLPRRRFCIVLLAPAVLVTLALLLGAWALGHPLMGWMLAVVHLAGCTGDIAYVRIIAHEPFATHVQDTATGIALIHDE